jgi:hypothetical protein
MAIQTSSLRLTGAAPSGRDPHAPLRAPRPRPRLSNVKVDRRPRKGSRPKGSDDLGRPRVDPES